MMDRFFLKGQKGLTKSDDLRLHYANAQHNYLKLKTCLYRVFSLPKHVND